MSNSPSTAIIGGGIAGLAAAYDLLERGHAVTIYEASSRTGGLAQGFRDDAWSWPLEHFYHHLFASDSDIIELARELGLGSKLFFPTPQTSILYNGSIYPFSNPLDWFRFPGFNLIDFVRFGFVGAFIRFTRFWQVLEKSRASEWSRRWYGEKIHNTLWKPLLINKFGPYYDQVNMAWLWARLYVRSFKLGYFEGGFQMFVDTLTDAVAARGGTILRNCPVRQIKAAPAGALTISANGTEARFDHAIVTTSPALFTQMVPDCPSEYLDGLRQLKSMGAVVLVLALKASLMDKTYWLNIPATSSDKSKNALPFLALVQHTNYIDRKHYANDHIVYCGDYVPPDHAYFEMSEDELATLFISKLSLINPRFSPDWVRARWLFRAKYAQPVPFVNHSKRVPDIATPVPNLYLASMSQVYPWDRGTNFAVQIGRRAARAITGE